MAKRATAGQTIAALGREIEQLRSSEERLQQQVAKQQHLIEQRAEEREALRGQIMVLQSDRDRLTAALDVCSRRLAQPSADKDVSRGGWRYSERAMAPREQEQDRIRG